MTPCAPNTEWLLAWREGNRAALDELPPLVYLKLRRLAHRYTRGERLGGTLNTASSEDTVLRDWRLAKGWPLRELTSHAG